MSADDVEAAALAFEAAYAARSRVAIEWIREYRTVRRCECGDVSCDGFAMIPISCAADWDNDAPIAGQIAGSVIEGRP